MPETAGAVGVEARAFDALVPALAGLGRPLARLPTRFGVRARGPLVTGSPRDTKYVGKFLPKASVRGLSGLGAHRVHPFVQDILQIKFPVYGLVHFVQILEQKLVAQHPWVTPQPHRLIDHPLQKVKNNNVRRQPRCLEYGRKKGDDCQKFQQAIREVNLC